jgi:hypothetical protein
VAIGSRCAHLIVDDMEEDAHQTIACFLTEIAKRSCR